MRGRIVAWLAVILALAIEARASYSVLVATPRYVRSSIDIESICGEATLGCTDVTAAELRTRCERRDDVWSTSADIRFAPVVHLPAFAESGARHHLLEHERAHLRDFHRAAESYARWLSERRFASAEDCRAAALQEVAAFGGWMREVARQSVALRR